MKSIVYVSWLLWMSIPAYSQSKSSSDVPVDTIFRRIQKQSIYRKQVNWDTLYQQFRVYTDTAANPYSAFRWLFTQLSDHHSSLTHRGKRYRHFRPKPVGREKTFAYLLKHENYNTIRVQRLGQYGYISMPGVAGDSLENYQFVKAFRDSICRVFRQPVEGWIVDVRANGGGNIFPMIAVLDFLIPDGIVATVHGANNEQLDAWSVKNGNTYQNKKPETTNGQSCQQKDITTPVVLLTSPLTVSSGEMLLIAFRGRKNTVTIGDTTGGLVTSNTWMDLSENTSLILSNGYVADRFGTLYKQALVPDIVLTQGYNFENLNEDAHVRRAVHWLDAHSKKKPSKK